MSTDVQDPAERPMRADALRNRERVLQAAHEAFAEAGPDVAVAEIARRAGVGAGTLFRHFPTKHDLLQAVLERTFDGMSASIEQALGMEDPWEGMVHVLTATAEVQARDRAFLQSIGPELFVSGRFQERTAALMVQFGDLIERAQRAGQVRDDLRAGDLPFLVAAVGGATDKCAHGLGECSPDLWRRYLGVVLDGLRPAGAHPLPQAAPTLEQLSAGDAAAPGCS